MQRIIIEPVILFLFLIIVLSSGEIRSEESALLPPDMNPVQAGVDVNENVRMTLEIFDSEPISKRHYDYIAPLDGITLGMGHYPQAGVADFFQSMSQYDDQKLQSIFITRMNEYLQTDQSAWEALKKNANMELGLELNAENVGIALNKTLWNDRFMNRYAENCRIRCKADQPDFYHEQEAWLVPVMKYALRDPEIVQWQVEYWNEYLLIPAEKKAKKSGLTSTAGVVGVASNESSAKVWGSHIAGAKDRGYISNDKAGLKWEWNSHPFINNPTEEQLESWRLLARWQYYCSKKKKIRNRSRAYYNTFLANDWELSTFSGGSEGTKDPGNWDPKNVQMKQP